MKRQNPSIFNDIIGPIMVGPSSSHTCGPARIGFLCSQLLEGNLKKAVVEFAREGAYTNMYKGQKTDLGFTSGLLGNRPEDPKLRIAHLTAREKGIEIDFKISDFEAIVPNISRITIVDDFGEEFVVQSDSTGGGTVKLLTVDNLPVSIVGDAYEILVFVDTSDNKQLDQLCFEIKSRIDKYEKIDYSTFEDKGLVNIKLNKSLSKELVEEIKFLTGVSAVKTMKPVLAVLSNDHEEVPFKSAQDILEIAERENKELWELALMYEKARSGWTEDEIINFMKKIIKIMEDGIEEALKGDIDMSGIIKPTSGKIAKKSKEKGKWLNTGILDVITPWSIATMEYSSAMGVVLCAPTGGSAGVIPGVILGAAKSIGASEEDKVKAMLATAIIGICMAKDCNFSAELYGCQVEPGAASAMAAGGLMHYMGGSVKQALDAASVAIQNILGIVCDPVAGLVQVPCIGRNASASANAVISANIIMGGFDACIPLDESTETMFRVGAQLPSELRCTCNGGLCTTPTGYRLAEEQNKRDAARNV